MYSEVNAFSKASKQLGNPLQVGVPRLHHLNTNKMGIVIVIPKQKFNINTLSNPQFATRMGPF